jgi:hypothetical protein
MRKPHYSIQFNLLNHIWTLRSLGDETSFVLVSLFLKAMMMVMASCLGCPQKQTNDCKFNLINVCFIKILSQLNIVLLLYLLRIFMKQTLFGRLEV